MAFFCFNNNLRELCAHIFIALESDFSENIFENGKILYNYDPQQQILEILACILIFEFSDETTKPDLPLLKIPVTCKMMDIYSESLSFS